MAVRAAEGLRTSLPAGLPCGLLCTLRGQCERGLSLRPGQHPAALPRAPASAAGSGCRSGGCAVLREAVPPPAALLPPPLP